MRLSLHTARLVLLSSAACALGETLGARFSDFSWDSIEPSSDLEYHDCYGEYKCARLVLPLDWLNATDPRTVTIAMMKLPAAVPDSDPAFAGSIFTNPGGPGHSGVTFVPRAGHHLQATVDKPGRRHYEFLSFDPRGVGLSTPVADCYRRNRLARDGVILESRGTLGLDSSDDALAYNYALGAAGGQRCKDADNDTPIFEYLSSASVARDMVEMLDKIHELRQKEAADDESWHDLKRRTASDDVPRLQYIGFSYGTLLGNFFASMFPGRVHRMLLDSVFDADDYVHGPGWLTNLELMDATFDEFFKGCHKAGPEVCALARDSDKAWDDVSRRAWAHIRSLDEAPQGFVNPDGYSVILSGRDIRDLVGTSVYSPLRTFKFLAKTFNDSLAGNNAVLFALLSQIGGVPILKNECPIGGPASNETDPNGPAEAVYAVLCTDGEDVSDKDFPYWRKYVSQLTDMSKVWGSRWAELRFLCSSWPFRAKWSFDGPFTTPEADPAPLPGRPSAPLLFLANRFDPVTPVSAARAMAALHPGAGLVVQESIGHGVVVGAPSNCTDEIVADYFESGAVPSGETTCKAECGPWDEHCENDKASSSSFSAQYLRPSPGQLRRFPLSV